MEKKTIVARMQVHKGKEKEFLAHTVELIKATRAEDGNISYTLYQSLENPAMFIFYEEYTNLEAMNKHASSTYLKVFGEAVKDLLAQEKIIERF